MKIEDIRIAIEKTTPRSAWNKGVKDYALDLLDNLSENNVQDCYFVGSPSDRKAILYGAHSWEQYSEGGCALIYNGDIAKRLCTHSELKKSREGYRNPNNRETWIDCQTRALYQAERLILRTCGARRF